MDSDAHRKLTLAIIAAVNYAMDNAPALMPIISEKLGIVPGLSYKGHRQRGHDATTATLNAISIGVVESLLASASHLTLDAFRDELKRKYGPAAADVIEDLLILGYEIYMGYTGQNRKKRRRKKSKS